MKIRDAVFTVIAVVVAVMALDDITTDNALSFPLERLALVGCAIWFLRAASRLWQQGQRVLGAVSFGLVALAAAVHPAIGQGALPAQFVYLAWAGYLATVGTLAWFLLVAGVSVGFAWYRRSEQRARA